MGEDGWKDRQKDGHGENNIPPPSRGYDKNSKNWDS